MPMFKAIAAYTTYCIAEYEADDVNQAYVMAKNMDGLDFVPSEEIIDWHISQVTEID